MKRDTPEFSQQDIFPNFEKSTTLKQYTVMKQIRFESKDESNKRRDEEAMRRTPGERMTFFFQLIEESARLYPVKKETNQNNFVLEKTSNK